MCALPLYLILITFSSMLNRWSQKKEKKKEWKGFRNHSHWCALVIKLAKGKYLTKTLLGSISSYMWYLHIQLLTNKHTSDLMAWWNIHKSNTFKMISAHVNAFKIIYSVFNEKGMAEMIFKTVTRLVWKTMASISKTKVHYEICFVLTRMP